MGDDCVCEPKRNLTCIFHFSPELAGLLIDPSLGKKYGSYSPKTVLWNCPNGRHRPIPQRIRTRVLGNCSACQDKIVLVGYNDMATTHPDLAAELVNYLRLKAKASSVRVVADSVFPFP